MKSPMPTVAVMKSVDERQRRPHGRELDLEDIENESMLLELSFEDRSASNFVETCEST